MKRSLPFLLIALFASVLGFSQEVEVAEEDPPGRVARISVVQGDVSFQAEDAQAPEEAILNRPMTIGDRLMTGPDSRAELSLGIAAVRVDERTDLSIANLDEDLAQLEVNSGAINVRLRELPEGETFEIDTPNATVRLMRPGDYRVDVESDGSTQLAVRQGDAQIDSGNGPVNVHDRQQARLSPGSRYADVVVLGVPDAFDEWSMDRERELDDAQATRYVSREVVGYEDLDRHGDWYSEPEYGEVRVPRSVVVGWAPYSFGRWVWVGPWGWTWVDHAPWGFAPFHYGRWAYVRHRWCWVPGPRHHRPIYAPAHVHWTDRHGGYFTRDRRPGSWIPLGPREVYVPGRRVSPRYLRNVNISNAFITDNTQITHMYRNRGRDWNYANRFAPGVGARYGFNGSQWQNTPGGTHVQPGDGRGRWVTGPNGRSGFNDRDRRYGDNRYGTDRRYDRDSRFNDRQLNNGNRFGRDGRWDNGNRGNGDSRWNDRSRWSNGNRDDNSRWNNDRHWSNPGDGHMTVPRTPTDRRQIQQGDRLRMERDAAMDARRFDNRRYNSDSWRYRRDDNNRTWNDNRGAGGNRNWNNNNRGWNDNRGDNRGYRVPGGPNRSYGGDARPGGGSVYRGPAHNGGAQRSLPQPSRSWQSSRSAESRSAPIGGRNVGGARSQHRQ